MICSSTAYGYVLQDTTGTLCGLNQSGPVWYLAGTFNSGSAERTCTVPANTALFFPVANLFLSAEAPTYAETVTKVQASWDTHFVSASATIDGVAVANLSSYYVVSPNFDLVLPDNNIFGRKVPAGTYSPSAAVGEHLLVAPLPAGPHEIHMHAVFQDPRTGKQQVIDVMYHLTVSG